jgi:hypothetical protein
VGWPRWALVAMLLLSLISLAQVLSGDAMRLGSAIEIVSCMLTAVGLYLSSTGDAQGWFNMTVIRLRPAKESSVKKPI